MKYNYEEWERMKIKGKTKFIFNFENLMIIIMFILIFLIVKGVTFRQGYLLKEFLFYAIYMIISFSVLLILAQSVRWNLYIKFSNGKLKNTSTIIIKLNEILIGLLTLWIPLGIFCSIFVITSNSYILKNLTFTLNYVAYFTSYILINSMVWIFIGVLLELFININFLKDNNQVYIFISKKVD
ncbi:hypothetical protein [Clostridium kluyveri]|uniref:Uncharacterized protein n=1 Tax=Clostridium kluyveri TaxID=1534 RepID=A0A1L5F7K2_CLOKL|nr:hypothetical protein [Clostridium kluyveri]APM38998.1 hypothetical protein BS101_09700 [Clostridium kluyveri]UZQ51325.1 hypothetical protein OP486_03880 [Clostridium kluyveri]